MIVAWLAGFCLYQWLSPQGPSWWTNVVAHAAPARIAVGRRVAAELRRRIPPRRAGAAPRQEAYPRGRVIALVGNLSRDVLPGRAPHVGGGPYHGARALRRLRVPARIVARCATADRDALLPPLIALGTPVRFVEGTRPRRSRSRTTAIAARCASTRSATRGHPPTSPTFRPRAGCTSRRSRVTSSRSKRSPRSRADAACRSTGRDSCACPRVGPLQLDADFDPELLRHIWVLKLSDEEAEVVGDVAALGVREVLLTHGSRGATVLVGGRSGVRPRARDPAATRPVPAMRSRPRTSSPATPASHPRARRGAPPPSSRRCSRR